MKFKKVAAILLAGCMVAVNAMPVAAEEDPAANTQETEVTEDLQQEGTEDVTETVDEEGQDKEDGQVDSQGVTDASAEETDGTQPAESTTTNGKETRENKETKAAENSLEQVYVSAAGDDTNGAGTQDSPVASLARAVAVAKDQATIYVMSNLTAKETARYYDKNLTVKSVGDEKYTITRDSDFATISDTARSWYNGAMIEVGSVTGGKASLKLENIVLDDAGRHQGEYFIQAASSGSGSTAFGNESINHTSIVHDAIIATYNGTGDIVLGNGAELKNYGGMSAVRLSGGTLAMQSGSRIYDDAVSDRGKGTEISGADKSLYGAAGAVWIQGGTLTMEQGSVIGSAGAQMAGRAVYVDGGQAQINGTIQNLKGDLDMWQGMSGVAIHVRGGGFAVLGETGVIDTITGEHAGYRAAVMTNGSRDGEHKLYDFEAKAGSVIKNVTNLNTVFSNYGTELLNGTITGCTNDYIVGGFASNTTIGETGVIENCDASKGAASAIVYTSNACDIHMKGTIRNNKTSEAFYIINQSGGGAELWIYEGALIQGTGSGTGVYVNASECKAYMMGGKITGFSTGVDCRGKKNRTATFIMDGGEISGNSSNAIYFNGITGSGAVVDINGGVIKENGSSYQISASGGKSEDLRERIHIAPGVVQGNTTIYLQMGQLTLDEDYAEVDLGAAKTEAVEKIKELVAADAQYAGWECAGSNALWIKPTQESVHFTISRSYSVKKTGLFVAYIPLTAEGLPQENAGLTLFEVENENTIDVTLKDLTPGTSYAVMFVNNDEYTISADDITVYTGGGQGDADYESGFPVWTLNQSLDSITSLEINGEDQGVKGNEAVEKLKELFNVTYLDETGAAAQNDGQAGAYTVKLTLKDENTKIRVNGNEVSLGDEDGTLIVRHASDVKAAKDGSNVHDLLSEAPTEAVQQAEAIGSYSYYTNNNTSSRVSDKTGIALLDEPLISKGEDKDAVEESEDLLQQKAESYLGAPSEEVNRYAYDFHYLDLVDTHNGNAWVAALGKTTVYLPYPEGTSKDTDSLKVIYYKGLDREYGINGQADADEAIQASTVETMEAELTDQGIKISVNRASFGMFAVVWEVEQRTVTVKYQDLEGNDLAEADSVKFDLNTAYDVSSYADKKIAGYHAEKVEGELKGEALTEDLTVIVRYDKDPQSSGGSDEPKKDTTTTNSANQTQTVKKSVKTGDTAPVVPIAVAAGISLLAAAGILVVILRKRRGASN